VPQLPPSRWSVNPPANMPTTKTLARVFFAPGGARTYQNGWAVGTQGTVVRSTDGGVHWAFSNTGVPDGASLEHVAFTSDNPGAAAGGGFTEAGFTAGNSTVLRSTDLGQNWVSIAPDSFAERPIALMPYNSRIVVLANSNGRVLRSLNANALTAGGVSWTPIETKPPARPADQVSFLRAGGYFAPNTSLAYLVGDAIYRLDADNPDPASVWKRVLMLSGNDGEGACVSMPSATEVWVGTTTGKLFHTVDGGNTWTKISSFFNREHNGGDTNLQISSITDLTFLDSNNGFLFCGNKVVDTQNGGVSWKETYLPVGANAFEIVDKVIGGNRQFIGWALGFNAEVMLYQPSP
jgi:photosystem II stability/assembly factor-like uncharacterized protein